MDDMDAYCDRDRRTARAVVVWQRDHARLSLCAHHDRAHAAALLDAGWGTVGVLDVRAGLRGQAAGAGL